MHGFSATTAALSGVTLTFRRPGLVALWGLVYLVLFVVVGGAAAAVFGVGLAGALGSGATPGPEVLAALPLLLLIALPLLVIVSVMLAGAIYRSELAPEDRGFAYIRFGGQELWLALAALVVGLILVVGVLLAALAIGAVSVTLENGALKVLTIIAVVLAALAGVVWLGVRLSLVAPLSFSERSLRLTEGWRLTAGRFWPLLGAYLLAFVFIIGLSIVASMIGFIPLAIGGGVMAAGGGASGLGGAGPALAIGLVLNVAVQIVAAILQVVWQTAPAASVLRQLSGPADAEVFA